MRMPTDHHRHPKRVKQWREALGGRQPGKDFRFAARGGVAKQHCAQPLDLQTQGLGPARQEELLVHLKLLRGRAIGRAVVFGERLARGGAPIRHRAFMGGGEQGQYRQFAIAVEEVHGKVEVVCFVGLCGNELVDCTSNGENEDACDEPCGKACYSLEERVSLHGCPIFLPSEEGGGIALGGPTCYSAHLR